MPEPKVGVRLVRQPLARLHQPISDSAICPRRPWSRPPTQAARSMSKRRLILAGATAPRTRTPCDMRLSSVDGSRSSSGRFEDGAAGVGSHSQSHLIAITALLFSVVPTAAIPICAPAHLCCRGSPNSLRNARPFCVLLSLRIARDMLCIHAPRVGSLFG